MDTIRTAISLLRTIQTGRAIYRDFGHALGLRDPGPASRSTLGRMATAAGLVGGGVLVGVGIGMLVAPMSGRELREKISDQAGEWLTELVFKDLEEEGEGSGSSEAASASTSTDDGTGAATGSSGSTEG